MLHKFLKRTQMLLDQAVWESRKAMAPADESAGRQVQVTQLEERILMSASPVAVVAAAPETAAAPVDTADQGISDQQWLDVVADNVLPPAMVQESIANSDANSSDTTAHTLELVFIDGSISNIEQMISDLRSESDGDDSRTLEVVVLDSQRDGIAQITAALIQYNGVDGMHIVSHGSDGQVQLGSTTLSLDNLDRYRGAISAWQYSMSDEADILIYGCNVAATEHGQELLNQLSELTATDVAASDDVTGHADLGGDWILEYQIGDLKSEIIFSDAFIGSYYATLDITSDLALHLTLDDGSGSTAVDATSNSNDGNLIGGSSWTSGEIGGALALDYTDGEDYIEVANSATLENVQEGDYTLASWFRPDSTPPGNGTDSDANYGIIVKEGWHNGLHFNNANRFGFEHVLTGNTFVGVQSTNTFTPGQFYHVVGVVDRTAGTVSLYVDGQLEGSNSFTPGTAAREYGTETWKIGIANPGGGSYGWAADGAIDEARIYSRSLSGSDVSELYAYTGSATTTATFQEGVNSYTSTVDTYVSQGSASMSFGDSSEIQVDLFDGGSDYTTQGLIRFDSIFGSGANQIPVGSVIASASLTFNVNNTSEAGANITLHQMLTNWSESSTWNSMNGGVSTNGVEAVATADSILATPTASGSVTFTGLGSTIQDWIDGTSTNYGWVIVSDSTNGWDAESSENAAANLRPKLSITWEANTAPTTSDKTIVTNEDAPYTFTESDFNYSDANSDPLNHIQITDLESVGSLELSGVAVTLNQTITAAQITAGNLKFVPIADQNGTSYDSFEFRVHDGTEYSDYAVITPLLIGTFNSNADGFTYADLVNGSWANGTYDAAGGSSGGGLRIDLAGGVTGGATSGSWSDTFTLTESTEITISTDYRLRMSSEYEANEYGELVLQINGTAYGDDTNTSLIYQLGDGGSGGVVDSGWQTYSTTITLGAGTHTLALIANNNDSTAAGEWVTGYFDNVSVTSGRHAVMNIDVTAVNDAPVIDNTGTMTLGTISEDGSVSSLVANVITSAGGDRITDVDAGAVEGIAITSVNNGNGFWRYSTDGGSTWSTVGTVSNTSALLLRATDFISYVGDGQNGGTADFQFRAWDQTSGTQGTKVDTSTNGATSAFSSAIETADITTTNFNDAPTIANAYTYNLTGTNENSTSSGTLASTILSSSTYADVDTGAVSGLAITGKTGNGTWQYSTDGTTWNTFGAVTSTNALMITSSTQVRYIPSAENGETATFTYNAWDRTTGTASTNATANYSNTASSGGTTAFSAESGTAQMVVTSVNDAPTLDNSGTMNLPTIAKSQTSNGGDTIASIVMSAGGNRIIDVDAGAVEGIAITALASGNGTWQYSTNGGTTWTAIGSVSNTSALLLRETDLVRFVPNGVSPTTASFDFRAWDQSTGSFGTKVNVSTNGGTTAFSTATETANITVIDVNTAPVLDNSKSPVLTTINEDPGVPSGVVGSLIAQLVDFATPSGQVDNVTDVDSGAGLGIAITAANTTNGTWFYSTNNGSTWNALGAVSDTNARLLAGDANTRLFFQANANYHGTLPAAITFHAWDQTSGSNGGVADLSSQTYSFRDNFSSASYGNNNGSQLWASNWSEVFDDGSPSSGSIQITGGELRIDNDNNGNLDHIIRTANLSSATSATLSFDFRTDSGVDPIDSVIVQVSGNGGANWTTLENFSGYGDAVSGSRIYNISGFMAANTEVRFAINNGYLGANEYFYVDNLQIEFIAPGTGGSTAFSTASDTASLNISPVADTPSITNATTNEDTQSASGLVITRNAVDGAEVTHYKITGVSNGTLYKNDGVTQITNGSFITIAEGNAGLKFTPTADFNGTGNFTLQASTSNGDAGLGGNTVLASVTVNPVNDAPLLADTALSLTVAEDAGAPSGTVGSLIGSLTGGISDVDSGAVKGIAIVASNETNGVWYYSTNGGTNWTAVGTVNSGSSLLLADNASTRLYFAPGTNYNGTSTSALTIRGWDQSTGTAGTKVNTSSNGSTFAFSSATDVIDAVVSAVNDAPIAIVDTATAVEAGGTANGIAGSNPTGNVLTNDTDVDSGDSKTVTGVVAGVAGSASGNVASSLAGTYGAITLNANGSYSYLVDNSNAAVQALRTTADTLTDVFTYTMVDAAGTSSTTQINVTIEGQNDDPTAVNDNAAAVEAGGVANGTAGTNPTGNVLSNDTDLDSGDTKTVVGVAAGSQPFASGSVGSSVAGSYGSITIASDGSYTFTVNNDNAAVQALRTASDSLTEVFTYTMQDAAGANATAEITVTITGSNDAPVAVANAAAAIEASGVYNNITGTNPSGNVLTNDTDVDAGDTKTVVGVAIGVQSSTSGSVGATLTGTYGSIVINFNGTYTYTLDNDNAAVEALNAGDSLNETFSYTIGDTDGLESTTQVVVTINGRTDMPVAVVDMATAVEDGGVANATTGVDPTGNVLDNDVSANGKTVVGVAAGDTGSDESGNVGVTVTGTYGSAVIQSDGSYIYTLDNDNPAVQALLTSGDHVTDIFTYSMEDSFNNVSSTTLTITVDGQNDNPIGNDDASTGVESGGVGNGTAGSNATGNVLTNDTDVDSGDTKTVTGVAPGVVGSASSSVGASVSGSYGSIVINSDGSFTYVINESNTAVQALRGSGNTLTDVFTYAMQDTAGAETLAQVTVTIEGSNDAPIAVVDTTAAYEAGGASNGTAGTNPTGNVLTNDADVDGGDTKTLVGVVAGAQASASGSVGSSVAGSYGNMTINSDGPYSYVVDNDNAAVQALRHSGQTLSDVFTYTMEDTDGLASTTQITITIHGANDNIAVVAETTTAVEAGGVANGTAGTNPSGNVLTNDSDVDSGDTMTISGVAAGTLGSATGSVGANVNGSFGSINLASDGSYTYVVDNNNASVQALNTGETLTDVLTYTVQDTSGAESTTQVTITIQGQNDNPVESLIEGSALVYTENDGAVAITSTITLSDIDDTDFESAVVAITGNYVDGEDVLTFVDQNGISGSWNTVTGELTLSGTATVALYQAAIRSITYTNTSDSPDNSTRTVSFTVGDGDAISNTQTRNITIGEVNDDPTNAGSLPSDISVTEDVSSNVDLSALDLSDIDANSGSLTVTLSTSTGGDLTASAGAGITVGTNGTSSITLTGTLADLNTYLNTASNVQYLHSVAHTFGNDADTINVVINDNGNTGSGGGADQNLGTVNVDITAVNDAPVSTGTYTATVNEGGSVTITATMLGDADVDDSGTGLIYTIDTLPANGQLELTTNPGVAISSFSQDDIDNNRVIYVHDDSQTLADSFDFTLADGGEDGVSPAPGTFGFTVTPVNDAPVQASIEGAALAYTENDGPVAITSTLAISDVDDTNIESAVVAISGNYANGEGVLAFIDQNGISGSWNATTGELTLTGSATLADYETALRSITYSNTSDDPSAATRTVSFTVNDGDANSNTQTRDIDFNAINDAPVEASIEGTPLAYTENDGAVAVTAAITISDLDDTNIESAVIAISGNYANGEDILTFVDQNGISGSWNATTGELTLTGSATLADYETALRSITYTNTSDNPSALTRTISFTVNDGEANSNTQTRDINFTAVNDAPVEATIEGTALGYTENDGPVAITSTLAISDVDDTNIESVVVQITGNYNSSEDVLSFTDQNGITGSYNAANGTWTLTGSATLAQYETAIRSIMYSNTSDNPSTATRTVSFTVNDGDVNSNTQTRDIDISAVNDAPVEASIEGTALAYTENDGPVAITSTLAISDLDDTNIESAVIQITGNYAGAEDMLAFTNQNGITGNLVGGTLTLTGPATIAQYETALRSITYTNSSEQPNTNLRTVSFTVNDGSANSNTQSRDIAITTVNDAPAIDLNGADGGGTGFSVSFTEGDARVSVTDTDATLSDVDNTTYLGLGLNLTGFVDGASEEIRINGVAFQYGVGTLPTTVVGGTTFTLDFDGSGFTITNNAGGSMPEADLQALIRTVEYENTSANPTVGVRTLNFIPQDAAGLNGTPSVSSVSLSAVNTAPTMSAFAAVVDTTNEDIQVEITFADLAAQGDEDDVDGTVTAFVIKNISTGTLLIGANAGSATAWAAGINDTIDSTNNAFWTPDANANGTLNAFTLVALDNGGLESTASITAQVSATNVNDVPNGSVTIDNTTPAQGDTLTASNTLADVDGLGAITYTWQADGVTVGTGSSYVMTESEVGQVITVIASYTDENGTNEAVTSAATAAVTNVNDVPTGLPLIIGTASEDQVLTADTSGISDVDGLGTFSYVWTRDNVAISGFTTSTYTLTDADVGSVIRIEVSYTDGNGTPEGPLVSNPTATVTNVNDVPVLGNNSLSILEGGTVVLSSSELSATDIDNVDSGLTFTVSGVTAGHFAFASTPQAAIYSFTQAQITAGQVIFNHDGSEATSAFSVSVSDGAASTTSAVASTSFINVNDAPIITALGGDVVAVFNDGVAVKIDVNAAAMVVDSDLPTDYAGATLQINGGGFLAGDVLGLNTFGAISLSAGFADGSIVSVGGLNVGTLSAVSANAATVTFNLNATSPHVDEVLQSFTFTTTSTILGSRGVDFAFNDADGTANGGIEQSSAVAASVWVSQAGDGLVTTNEDTTYTFVATDFDFTGATGSNLQFIEVLTLPVDGTLTLNGSVIGTGQVITKAQIDSGLLRFVPVANGNGVGYASFDFRVNNGKATLTVLAGEPTPYTLNGTYLPNTDAILAKTSNFGVSGTYSSNITVVAQSSTIDAAYLAQGQVLFNGYVVDGSWTGGELTAVDTWVQNGGVLISTSDSNTYDDVSAFYGLTIGGTASSNWLVTDDASSIMNGPFGLVGTNGSAFQAAGAISYFNSASLAVGDQVLAVDSVTGQPTIVLRQHGSGWILFTGDEGIFRANMAGGGAIATANDRLVANIFAWSGDQLPGTSSHTMNVNVNAVNDDPFNSSSIPASVTVDEDVTTAVDLSFLNLVDIDSAVGNLTVTLTTSGGGTLSAISGGGIAVGGTGTNTLTLAGTVSRLNTFISNATAVSFTSAANVHGNSADSIAISINDNGNVGSGGGATIILGTVNVDITPVNDNPAGLPTIVGTVQEDEALTADTSGISDNDGLGTFSYQWLRNGVSIVGATGSSYTLGDADVNTNISVEVAYTDGWGTDEGPLTSSAVGPVANVNDAPTGIPTIVGTAAEDQTISADISGISDNDGLGTFSYQWLRDGVAIVGETATTYTLTDIDVATDITVEVSYTDGWGTNEGPLKSLPSTVAGINDAPVNTVPGTQTVVEETQTAIMGISITDIDANGLTVTTRLQVVNGVLDVTLTGSATISAGSNSSADLTISGNVAEINATLTSLRYTSNLDVIGTSADALTITTNDSGNTGSGGALQATDTVQIDITNVNDEEVLSTNIGITVNEGDVSSIIDAVLLETTDVDNTPTEIVYSLTGLPTSGTLQLNGVDLTNGQTFTQADINANRLTYDHNDAEVFSDSFAFRINDGSGTITPGTFAITITPVNDNAPVIISAGGPADAAIAIVENITVVTTVTANDADLPSQTLTFSIVGGPDGALFAIDGGTGALSFATAPSFETILDADGNNVYEVIVEVNDGQGLSSQQTVRVTMTDTDEFDVSPIVDNNAAANNVDENVASGTIVGITAFSEDFDATTNVVAYSLDNNAGGLFSIDSATGVVTTAAAIDYETVGSELTITVRATGADGSTATQDYTVTVNDLNDNLPVISPNQSFDVSEFAVVSTSLGSLTASDVDTVGSLRNWTITNGNADNVFAVDAATGELTIADASKLNFETTPSYTLTLAVEDGANVSLTHSVAVNVVNENDVPILFPTTVLSVNENSANGTAIGLIVATDEDVGDTLSYRLIGSGLAFEIDSVSGELFVTDVSQLDFETTTSFALTVEVTDTGGNTDSQVIIVNLNDINESPLDVVLTGDSVDENSAVGTIVGRVTGIDPDALDFVSFSLTDNADGRFQIGSVTGIITVANGGLLNHEQATSHDVRVRATDSDGLYNEGSFQLTINDVNEAPAAHDDAFTGRQMEELNVSLVTSNGFDVDGDVISIVLVAAPLDGHLTLNSNGTLIYVPNGTFSGSDSFTYVVTDGSLYSNIATVQIEILATVSNNLTDTNNDATFGNVQSPATAAVVESESETRETESQDEHSDSLADSNAMARLQHSEAAEVEAIDASIVQNATQQVQRRADEYESILIFLDGVPEVDSLRLLNRASPSESLEDNERASVASDFLFEPVMTDSPFFVGKSADSRIQINTATRQEQIDREIVLEKLVVGSTAAVSTSLSVGYVIWLLRGGTLLTTFLSSIPTWQAFDPLPVLDSFEPSEHGDKETLESIVSGAQ